ncbi:hypothetical protein OXX79_012627, partial [Metschnikowia pulcherrima]
MVYGELLAATGVLGTAFTYRLLQDKSAELATISSKLRKRIEQLEQELKEKKEQFDKQSKSDLTLHEKSLKEQIDLVRKGDADLTKLTSENGKLSSEISQLQSEVT